MMDLVFCGTPEFAIPVLQRLVAAEFRVRLVVTQPDRARGRGLEVGASPVKRASLELSLPVFQPDKIKNNDAFRAELQAIAPQAIIVVGYGRIIPQWMIDLPPLGNLNVHASLLPKYRGGAPIQWQLHEARPLPVSLSCESMPDSIPAMSSCRQKSRYNPMTRRSRWLRDLHIWGRSRWFSRSPGWPKAPFSCSRRTIRSRRLHRSSSARTA